MILHVHYCVCLGSYFCDQFYAVSPVPYSVKWVGLFVIILAGLVTIKQLWDLLGNLNLPMVSILANLCWTQL